MWPRAAIPGYKHTNPTIIYVNLLLATAVMHRVWRLKLAYEAANGRGLLFSHRRDFVLSDSLIDFCNTDS